MLRLLSQAGVLLVRCSTDPVDSIGRRFLDTDIRQTWMTHGNEIKYGKIKHPGVIRARRSKINVKIE